MKRLSRLDITKDVSTESTPIVVWQEIARAHGIACNPQELLQPEFRERLLRTIKENPVELKLPMQPADLGLLARFINASETKWTKQGLVDALNHLYNKPHIVTLPPVHVSPISMANPRGLDVCMVYAYCNELEIPLRPQTTLEEMESAVAIWRNSSAVICHYTNMATSLVPEKDFRSMINRGVLSIAHKYFKWERPKMEALRKAHDELMSHRYPYAQRPNTIPGLICWAARQYQTNLLRQAHPLLTLARLISGVEHSGRELSHLIDPDLPMFYSPKQLATMMRSFGLSDQNASQDMYSILANHMLHVKTFYPGYIFEGRHDLKTTVALAEDVSKIPPAQLLIFGTGYHADWIITYAELAKSFEGTKTMRNYYSPNKADQKNFDKHVRDRLRFLIDDNPTVPGTQELSLVMANLELQDDKNNRLWVEWREGYRAAPDELKSKMRSMTEQLVNCAMYMRSWRGPPHPYPIEDAPADEESVVNVRVTIAMNEFEDYATKVVKEWGVKFLQLPLLRYTNREWVSPPANAPQTIKGRLDLVRLGTDVETADSCIRMSSNWLLCSAYRAQLLVGIPVPCPLAKLDYIT